jgi:hypothetical protein
MTGRENQGLAMLVGIVAVLFFALLVAGYIAGKA